MKKTIMLFGFLGILAVTIILVIRANMVLGMPTVAVMEETPSVVEILPTEEVQPTVVEEPAPNITIVEDKGGKFRMVPSTRNSPGPVAPENPHLGK